MQISVHSILFSLFITVSAISAAAQTNLIPASSRQVVQPQGNNSANRGHDVFVPIGKYLAQGNSDALSAWFADNLEISILSQSTDASRAQALQIVKSFFSSHTPRSFIISHTSGRGNMKYALGELKAGGEAFNVTIFVNCKNGDNRIQQLKIERP